MNENKGWKYRRLMRTVSYFMIIAIVFATAAVQWPSIAEAGSKTVYLSGTEGNNEADGSGKETAVRSFWKAKKLVGKEGSILICGTITVKGDAKWAVPAGVEVKRAEGFTGALVNVEGTLTLRNISFSAEDISGEGTVVEKKALEKSLDKAKEAGKAALTPEEEAEPAAVPTKEAEKEEADPTPTPTKEAEKEEADPTPAPTKEAEKEETDPTPAPTKEAEKEEADPTPAPTKEAEKEEADPTPAPTKEAEKEEADPTPAPTKEAEKEEPTPEVSKEPEKTPITPEAKPETEKPDLTEGVEKLQKLTVSIVSEEDVQAVIDAYRWYEGCTEEEKAMVPKELVIRLKKAQSAVGVFNHTSNGISVTGELPWYVQFKAEKQDGDEGILGAYEMTLWNLLEDAPYLLDGEEVTVKLPVEDIENHEEVTIAQKKDDGTTEDVEPTEVDDALYFDASALLPENGSGDATSSFIAGSQVIVGPTQDIYDQSGSGNGSSGNGSSGSNSSGNSSSSGSSSSDASIVKPQISTGNSESSSNSSSSGDRGTTSSAVRTGDMNNLIPYIAVLCAATTLLILLLTVGKKEFLNRN